MQSLNFLDFFYPIAALYEWSPMTAHLIAAIVLCIIYLKWIGWTRIKNCPRPFINVPILAVCLFGLPLYGLHQFMTFLTKVSISIDCTASSSTTVMPADGVLYEVSLAKYTGNADYLAQRFGPGGTEVQLAQKIQVIRRCHVINHGPIPIFNAELTLHLLFKGAIRDSENQSTIRSGDITLETDWTIHPPTIDVGQPGFVFYVVNSSQEFVFVTIGEFVTFKRANRDDRDTTRLMQFPGFEMSFSPR